MATDTRAQDIRDLEKLLNDAEGDEELSDKAIEIAKRIRTDRMRAGQKVDISRAQILAKENSDFKQVIAEIRRRRGAQVLDKFEASDAYKKWKR